MKTREQQDNINKVKGLRVRFVDCDTRRTRTGVILDYCAPLCWHIQPDKGRQTYAMDRDVRTLDGRQLVEVV